MTRHNKKISKRNFGTWFISLYLSLFLFKAIGAEHRDPETFSVRSSSPEADEEITVTAASPDRSEIPSLNTIYDTYYAHRRGASLYLSGEIPLAISRP